MTQGKTAPDGRAVVEVALGVLVDRQNGLYLMGSRPQGKPYAGYWEFPGGKVEPGESCIEALKREFVEELGIELADITPWFVLEHAYEHAYVRLHYFRVWSWKGNLTARENQSFGWFNVGEVDSSLKMLPMNALVVERMAVPQVLAAVDDPEAFESDGTIEKVGGLLLLPERKRDGAFVLNLKRLAQKLGIGVYTCETYIATSEASARDEMQDALFGVVRQDDADAILQAQIQRLPLVVEAELQELEQWVAKGAHGVFVRL